MSLLPIHPKRPLGIVAIVSTTIVAFILAILILFVDLSQLQDLTIIIGLGASVSLFSFFGFCGSMLYDRFPAVSVSSIACSLVALLLSIFSILGADFFLNELFVKLWGTCAIASVSSGLTCAVLSAEKEGRKTLSQVIKITAIVCTAVGIYGILLLWSLNANLTDNVNPLKVLTVGYILSIAGGVSVFVLANIETAPKQEAVVEAHEEPKLTEIKDEHPAEKLPEQENQDPS